MPGLTEARRADCRSYAQRIPVRCCAPVWIMAPRQSPHRPASHHDVDRSLRPTGPDRGGSPHPAVLRGNRCWFDDCGSGRFPGSTAPRPLRTARYSDRDHPGRARRRPPQLCLGAPSTRGVCHGCLGSAHPPSAVCVSITVTTLPPDHTDRERSSRLGVALVAPAR